MAEYTANYNLEKQQENEYININGINNNFDVIDEKIKEAKDKAEQAFQSASNGKNKIVTAITGIDPEVTIPENPTFDDLATAIGEIETGVDTSDATATASDLIQGKTAYANGAQITGSRILDPGRISGTNHINCDQLTVGDFTGDGTRIYIRQSAMASGEVAFSKDTHFSKKVSELDYNLIPANILSGKSILGVNGTAIEGIPGAWGTGLGSAIGTTQTFYQRTYPIGGIHYFTVSGLNFKPRAIMIFNNPESYYGQRVHPTIYAPNPYEPGFQTINTGEYNFCDKEYAPASDYAAYVNSTGFLLPLSFPGYNLIWVAFK